VICGECGTCDAKVSYTEFADGKATTWNLCEECARKRGVSASLSSLSGPLVNILMGLLEEVGRDGAVEAGPRCDACGLTLAEFRRTGRLGCSACYGTFRDELKPLVRRIHGGGGEHTGRVPGSLEASEGPRREILRLRTELDHAVKREEYERAAALRDLIRKKEEGLRAGKSDVDV
jgi:protein arginine kinase activator